MMILQQGYSIHYPIRGVRGAGIPSLTDVQNLYCLISLPFHILSFSDLSYWMLQKSQISCLRETACYLYEGYKKQRESKKDCYATKNGPYTLSVTPPQPSNLTLPDCHSAIA